MSVLTETLRLTRFPFESLHKIKIRTWLYVIGPLFGVFFSILCLYFLKVPVKTLTKVKSVPPVPTPQPPNTFPDVEVLSPYYLTRLSENELNVYAQIKKIDLSQLTSKEIEGMVSSLINEYVADYEDAQSRASKLLANRGNGNLTDWPSGRTVAEIQVDHPILAYRMVRRFSKTISSLIVLTGSLQYDSRMTWSEAIDYFGWPLQEDLDLIMENILRLQLVYDFDLREITSGLIGGRQTEATLKAEHCYEIGRFALDKGHFAFAILWLEEGLRIIESGASDLESDLSDTLAQAIEEHDEAFDLNPNDDQIFKGKLTGGSHGPRVTFKTYLTSNYQDLNLTSTIELNAIKSWLLCSGGRIHQGHFSPSSSEQKCWFETKSNPAWVINPLKMELLSHDPYLLQIHGVLSLNQCNDLKSQGITRGLSRSTTHPKKVSDKRTSVNAWIHYEDPSLARLSELLTGLSVVPPSSSESLQIASYIFGSHFVYHHDAFINDENLDHSKAKGNRMATIMFYIDDTPEGGYTVFPDIGIVGRPERGSALYWYNLHLNGTRDARLHHSGCPVLLGQKWLATKWIRSNDQMFLRKCSVDVHF